MLKNDDGSRRRFSFVTEYGKPTTQLEAGRTIKSDSSKAHIGIGFETEIRFRRNGPPPPCSASSENVIVCGL